MLNTLFVKLYLFMTLLDLLYCSFIFECYTAEEGRNATMTLRWASSKVGSIFVSKDGLNEDFVYCDLLGSCKFTNRIFQGSISNNVSSDHIYRRADIVMYNTSRDYNGTWRLRPSALREDIYEKTCELSVFARPKQVRCHSFVKNQNESVTITCRAVMVFPKAKCAYILFQDGVNSITQYHNFTYVHNETMIRNTTYYTSLCSFQLNYQTIINISSITVVIYPNVIGGHSSLMYGSNFTLRLFNLTTDEFHPIVESEHIASTIVITITISVVLMTIIFFLIKTAERLIIKMQRLSLQKTSQHSDHFYETVDHIMIPHLSTGNQVPSSNPPRHEKLITIREVDRNLNKDNTVDQSYSIARF